MTDHSHLLLNTRPISLFKSVSRGAGFLACVLGIAVLFGWTFDISTLTEYMTNWNLGIDQLLFKEPSDAVQTAYPGRMAFNTALNFLLTGLALLLLDVEVKRGRRPAQYLIIAQGTLSLLTVADYIHSVLHLHGAITIFTAMALHTAAGFQLVFIGIMTARPDRGLMAILADHGIGGLTARRLLIAAFAIPVVLNILTLVGERVGLYSDDSKDAIQTILVVVVFTFFALNIAGVLARLEMKLRKANDELAEWTAALMLSEERLRLLIDNVPDYSIIMLHPDGRIASWNAGAERLTGYRAEEIIGQNFSRFYTEEDNQQGTPQMLLNTALSKGRAENEGWRIRKNGARFMVNSIFTALYDKNGNPRGFSIVARDITERKRADETLREYITRVEQSNRDLQEFAYVASHDLQEPLRKITAFSDRLVSKYDNVFDESGRDYLKRMNDASQRMQTLLNDLLAYSRVATHARPFTSVHLNTVAQHVIADLDTRIKKTNGKIVIEELPVIAEPTQMYQLLQNLVTNALKYHYDGCAPIINISGQIFREQCQIMVKDNGIGFDVKYLDRIFKAFQRLHSRDKYEGTGMGLAICRRIAERHHGKITATSAPGKGSTFLVTLPVRQT